LGVDRRGDNGKSNHHAPGDRSLHCSVARRQSTPGRAGCSDQNVPSRTRVRPLPWHRREQFSFSFFDKVLACPSQIPNRATVLTRTTNYWGHAHEILGRQTFRRD
jgi:hypothetical protein